MGEPSQSLFVLWRWRDGSSATCSYELTCQHLHNLLARGDVPPPEGLHLRDASLWASQIAYAQEISHRMLWPLLYLGKPIGGGKYEPDPSLWDRKAKRLYVMMAAHHRRPTEEAAHREHARESRVERSPSSTEIAAPIAQRMVQFHRRWIECVCRAQETRHVVVWCFVRECRATRDDPRPSERWD